MLPGCRDDIVREKGAYPDGSPAWERHYRVMPDARKVPHGARASWHPRGARRSLEFFDRGLRHGYSFRWNDRGDLIRLEMCEDGFCRECSLPREPVEGAAEMARTRFR
jgi:hypothetical protein